MSSSGELGEVKMRRVLEAEAQKKAAAQENEMYSVRSRLWMEYGHIVKYTHMGRKSLPIRN